MDWNFVQTLALSKFSLTEVVGSVIILLVLWKTGLWGVKTVFGLVKNSLLFPYSLAFLTFCGGGALFTFGIGCVNDTSFFPLPISSSLIGLGLTMTIFGIVMLIRACCQDKKFN